MVFTLFLFKILKMKYYKYSITITPDTQEFREIVMAMLGELGFESFVENETNLDAFIQTPLHTTNMLSDLTFEPLFTYSFEAEEIPDQNWNEVWEKNYFKPLIVSNKCVVRAPFHTEYPILEHEIIIEPNMAFGTGNHETTTMMMEYLLELDIAGKLVLDMGCGTGILAILASQCGAAAITAIDIDKWSYEGTTENARLNNIQNITPLLGDKSAIPNSMFDLILANIQRNVILADLPAYFSALKPNGALLVSGFYLNDLNDIIQKANSMGLALVNSKDKNNWCSACFTVSGC
jgi:ribosomal protein L11 methyltransferase